MSPIRAVTHPDQPEASPIEALGYQSFVELKPFGSIEELMAWARRRSEYIKGDDLVTVHLTMITYETVGGKLSHLTEELETEWTASMVPAVAGKTIWLANEIGEVYEWTITRTEWTDPAYGRREARVQLER